MPGASRLQNLRASIASLESAGRPDHGVTPFGDERIDSHLPGGGLARGVWHTLTSDGLEMETGAAAGSFAALLARPLTALGAAVWVLRRDDLYAPGLSALGFPAQRLIFVRAADDDEVLAAVEDAARAPGVAVVVGEADSIDLIAGRRLQLACSTHGATALLIERRPFGGKAAPRDVASPSTRWRIAAAPSRPDIEGLGLGAPCWRVALERCRGGRPGEWIIEMKEEYHGPYPLRVVAELGDHRMAAPVGVAAAG
jgi:protein ImuA